MSKMEFFTLDEATFLLNFAATRWDNQSVGTPQSKGFPVCSELDARSAKQIAEKISKFKVTISIIEDDDEITEEKRKAGLAIRKSLDTICVGINKHYCAALEKIKDEYIRLFKTGVLQDGGEMPSRIKHRLEEV